MILGSHNTMSYLPVRRWWMKPFAWVARCQSKDICEQYDSGVRLFDLRVGFTRNGKLHFRHGLIGYKGSVADALRLLCSWGDTTVRIILEERSSDWDSFFRNFVNYVVIWEGLYPNIKFVAGVRKHGWVQLCDLPQIESDMLQWCASMQGGKLSALCPWLWAKHHAEVPQSNKKYLLKDFV